EAQAPGEIVASVLVLGQYAYDCVLQRLDGVLEVLDVRHVVGGHGVPPLRAASRLRIWSIGCGAVGRSRAILIAAFSSLSFFSSASRSAAFSARRASTSSSYARKTTRAFLRSSLMSAPPAG